MNRPQIDIPVSEQVNSEANYEWSDENPYSVIEDARDDTELRLGKLCDKAILAYAIGCAEWVVGRLGTLCKDESPYYFLDACWAFDIAEQFVPPAESDPSEWKGSVRGAIDLALMSILNTIMAMEDESAHMDAAYVEAIAIHVVDKDRSFFDWREKILFRLERHYSKADEYDDCKEVPISPAVITPRIEFDEDLYRGLCDEFINYFKSSGNPFYGNN